MITGQFSPTLPYLPPLSPPYSSDSPWLQAQARMSSVNPLHGAVRRRRCPRRTSISRQLTLRSPHLRWGTERDIERETWRKRGMERGNMTRERESEWVRNKGRCDAHLDELTLFIPSIQNSSVLRYAPLNLSQLHFYSQLSSPHITSHHIISHHITSPSLISSLSIATSSRTMRETPHTPLPPRVWWSWTCRRAQRRVGLALPTNIYQNPYSPRRRTLVSDTSVGLLYVHWQTEEQIDRWMDR